MGRNGLVGRPGESAPVTRDDVALVDGANLQLASLAFDASSWPQDDVGKPFLRLRFQTGLAFDGELSVMTATGKPLPALVSGREHPRNEFGMQDHAESEVIVGYEALEDLRGILRISFRGRLTNVVAAEWVVPLEVVP